MKIITEEKKAELEEFLQSAIKAGNLRLAMIIADKLDKDLTANDIKQTREAYNKRNGI